MAKKRGVFKVETIGDCYVGKHPNAPSYSVEWIFFYTHFVSDDLFRIPAVTGLPKPRKDHAVAMVRFARDCREEMRKLTIVMSRTLGPGTEELCMRFGMNSGPVTAGVLRGEKSRFQLFGDVSYAHLRGIRNDSC